MRAYASAFRIRLIAGMQYRSAAWAGVATQFAWGFMLLMIYHAFYASSTVEPPMSYQQLAAYIWLQQSFLALLMLWRQDGELLESIQNGLVAYELCRPVSLYAFWSARLLATRIADASLRCLPILVVAFFLPGNFRLTLPPDIAALGLFLLSLALSALLAVAVSMFIYILTFVTLSSRGSTMIVTVFADFLCGSLIPIPLMPPVLQRIAMFFPFRYIFDLPLRIYSGNYVHLEALGMIGLQALWVLGLGLLGALLMRRVLRRTVIQGG